MLNSSKVYLFEAYYFIILKLSIFTKYDKIAITSTYDILEDGKTFNDYGKSGFNFIYTMFDR